MEGTLIKKGPTLHTKVNAKFNGAHDIFRGAPALEESAHFRRAQVKFGGATIIRGALVP